MVQKKYIIFLTLFLFSCAHQQEIIIQQEEQISSPEIPAPPLFVIKPNVLLFISAQQTKGDLWIYDIYNFKLNQISFFDNNYIKIIGASPDLNYVFIADETEKPYVYYPVEKSNFKIEFLNENFYLLSLKKIEHITNNSYVGIGSDYKYKDTLILISKEIDNSWKYRYIFYNIFYVYTNIKNFSISYDKKYFAFAWLTQTNKNEIFVQDINSSETKKIASSLQSNVYLIWNESNDAIYFNEANKVYITDLNGFTKILFVENSPVIKMFINPQEKFKLYYILSNKEEYSELYIKDLDKLGKGELFKIFYKLKDIIFFDRETIFYDTYQNEIYSLNLKTGEEKLLFNFSALYQLVNEK